MSTNSAIGNIFLNLVPALAAAAVAWMLVDLKPDMGGEQRKLIALAVLTIGFLLVLVLQASFQRFKILFTRYWRYVFIVCLLVFLEFAVFLASDDWGVVGFSVAHLVLVGAAIWIINGYRRDWAKRARVFNGEFVDDFQSGLGDWDYEGEWRIEDDTNDLFLVVTESGKGGIAKPCLEWVNYVFEFETKIIKRYTSWIIRAKDNLNYAMLQCGPDCLRPHFRIKGDPEVEWVIPEELAVPVSIPQNTWFGVRIEVVGNHVAVTVAADGKERTIFSQDMLAQPLAPEDYQCGSVGFRNFGSECAHFRRVRVRRN